MMNLPFLPLSITQQHHHLRKQQDITPVNIYGSFYEQQSILPAQRYSQLLNKILESNKKFEIQNQFFSSYYLFRFIDATNTTSTYSSYSSIIVISNYQSITKLIILSSTNKRQ